MLTKRIIGTVIVKNGWAVQSFGYKRYLPLGSPKCVVENLDRWGADEIIVMCIDRNSTDAGPDLELLTDLSNIGLSTTLVYAGGIQNSKHALSAIRHGADRICLGQVYHNDPEQIEKISCEIGSQAVVLSYPCQFYKNKVVAFNYKTKKIEATDNLFDTKTLNAISEILLIDHIAEGNPGKFNFGLVENFPIKFPLITYGGIWGYPQISYLSECENVSAIAIGNPLNFKESSINQIKETLDSAKYREPYYNTNRLGSNHD